MEITYVQLHKSLRELTASRIRGLNRFI